MTNPSDTPARAASPALPLALVHFGESIAAGTVAAVRSRDWRALLVLGVVAILLCRLATLVLRIRAGLLPAPRRASPSTQTPPAERRNPPASSGASARAVRAMANAVPRWAKLRPSTCALPPRPAALRPSPPAGPPLGRRLALRPRAFPALSRPRKFFEALGASYFRTCY